MLSFKSGSIGNGIKMFLKGSSFGGIRFLWGFVLSKNSNASLGSSGIAMNEIIIWLSLLSNSDASLSSGVIAVDEIIIWLLSNGNTSLGSGVIAMNEIIIWLRFLSVHGIELGVGDGLEWGGSSVLHVDLGGGIVPFFGVGGKNIISVVLGNHFVVLQLESFLLSSSSSRCISSSLPGSS